MHSVYHRQILRWGALVKLLQKARHKSTPRISLHCSDLWHVVSLVSYQPMFGRRPPRLSPRNANFLLIHFTCFHHCQFTPVSQQQYADDTQLCVALLPANYSQDISALESCLNSLRIWFCENGMALNTTKSVAIFFGTPKRFESFFLVWNPVTSLEDI